MVPFLRNTFSCFLNESRCNITLEGQQGQVTKLSPRNYCWLFDVSCHLLQTERYYINWIRKTINAKAELPHVFSTLRCILEELTLVEQTN